MSDIDWRTMLVLAGLSYRGGVSQDDAVVAATLEPGLREHAPGWTRVWGPVTGRRTGDPLDACAMYVARAEFPVRYVVAVRGTNPLSVSDWVFGDFNVATTVAWPTAAAGAELSTSTAFGLGWLLALRDEAPDLLSRLVAHIAGNAALPSALLDAVREVTAAREWIRSVTMGRAVRRLGGLLQGVPVNLGLTAFAGKLIASAVQVTPAELDVPAARGAGGLLEFLATASEREPAAFDVIVTGHSKGGALAPALALWLHENRGAWDPQKRTRIQCCAFAGPTPGNGTLARRMEDVFGDGLCRVVNTNDIVTHAWALADLHTIPELYGLRSRDLTGLIRDVEEDLRQQKLDYRQPGSPSVRFAGRLSERGRSFADEFVYQHMDAYLDRAGLMPRVDAIELFAG